MAHIPWPLSQSNPGIASYHVFQFLITVFIIMFQEKRFREQQQELNTWHQVFWEKQNEKFSKVKSCFVTSVLSENIILNLSYLSFPQFIFYFCFQSKKAFLKLRSRDTETETSEFN